jgi:hypothetical protein
MSSHVRGFWSDEHFISNYSIPFVIEYYEFARHINSDFTDKFRNNNKTRFEHSEVDKVSDIASGIANKITSNIVSDAEQALTIARFITREREIDIDTDRSREIDIDTDRAISIALELSADIYRTIAMSIAMSIATNTEKENMIFENNAIHLANVLVPLAIFGFVNTREYFTERISNSYTVLCNRFWKTQIEDVGFVTESVTNSVNNNLKTIFQKYRIEQDNLERLYASFCLAQARFYDMKHDLSILVDCFRALALSANVDEIKIGAMRKLARQVVVDKTLAHNTARRNIKQMGLIYDEAELKTGNRPTASSVARSGLGDSLDSQKEIELYNNVLKKITGEGQWRL